MLLPCDMTAAIKPLYHTHSAIVEFFGFWALFLIRGHTAQGSKMFYDTGKFIDGLFQSNDRPVWDMLPGDVAQ